MKIIIQKYGGSSVATIEALKKVATRVVQTKRLGYAVVVVVSAMGRSTDELVQVSRQMSPKPARRELDALLATGEMVSMSLLAMAINDCGERAVSLNAAQCGIFTNDVHSNARITEVDPMRMHEHLQNGEIVVVAGFQGTTSNGDLTTLGRGGSDTTAVALAAALNAEQCEIYTDVTGVWTADPLTVPQARHLKELGTAEMQEFAWTGAKVLKAEAVEFAGTNNVPIVVRSTFEAGQETWVYPPACAPQTFRPRRPEVAGVAGRKDVIRIGLSSTDFGNGYGELIFDLISDFDLILGATGSASEAVDILISNREIPNAAAFALDLRTRFGHRVALTDRLGLISIVGFGLGTRPTFFLSASKLLSQANISVMKSFTTRESLCFVVPANQVDEGVRLMHDAFIQTQFDSPVELDSSITFAN